MKNFFTVFTIFVLLNTTHIFSQTTSAASGNWSLPSTWVGGIVPSAASNVVIAAGHTVTLDTTTIQCNDLTINASNATLRFSIAGNPTGITINGNLNILSGGRMRVEARNPAGAANSYYEHTLTIKGNLTNNGTLDLRGGSTGGGTSNGVLTTFTGNGNSTILLKSKTYQASVEEFNGITINKSGNGKVILASGNLFMNSSSSVGPSVLTLTRGIIETGSNIWATAATGSASVTAGSDSSYISGIQGRGMNSSAESEKKFEIGDADGYRPIIIRTSTGGIASGHYVFAEIVKGNADNGSGNIPNSLDSLSRLRYYKIGYSKGGIAGSADTMGFKQFSPFYREDDGVFQNMLGLMVAYSIDDRFTWFNAGPTNHVVDLSNPPTELQSTAINPVFFLKDSATMFVSLAFGAGIPSGLIPTIPNGSYGTHPLHKFDFWKAPSDKPTPLVVHIHGGGLTSGSKSDISLNYVSALLAKGISVMSINYRLSPEVVVPQHYLDCARAIQYARHNAKILNIDPNKIGASGSSAGALTSFWLNFHDDLADPLNVDSVLRMSSRLKGVACWSGQTSVDKRIIPLWVGPYVLDFASYTKGAIFGLPADSMDTPTAHALMEMGSPINFVTHDDPPVWMYYSVIDTPKNSSEAIHHVNFGKQLKYKMDSIGLSSSILTPAYSGSVTDSAVKFFLYQFTTPSSIVNREPATLKDYQLEQNYPNPFNPETSIGFSLPVSGIVELRVFDILGKEVATLLNERMENGKYSVRFNASALSSGMYFYSLKIGGFTETKKMILMR